MCWRWSRCSDAFASATIWQALAHGWSVEHLFGYGADDEQQVANFGIYTAIGLGMVREVLLVEKHIAVLRWANADVEDLQEKVSFRYDRRLMDKAAMVVWLKTRGWTQGLGGLLRVRCSTCSASSTVNQRRLRVSDAEVLSPWRLTLWLLPWSATGSSPTRCIRQGGNCR